MRAKTEISTINLIWGKYYYYFVAPVICTVGGGECDGNADGLTSCPVGGGICKGKLIIHESQNRNFNH